jgi:DNA invertase Pin-like site-specific DNA recombinase
MHVGYARVSTVEQSLALQQDALYGSGCERIFSDVAGGTVCERKGLAEALSYLRSGDTLVVWKLDRLGRSLKHLIETVGILADRSIGFVSLQENLDTTTGGGRLIFHLFGALAEFERELIRERTKAGLRQARARGRIGGRPTKLDSHALQMAKTLMADPNTSVTDICRTLRVARSTLYRALARESRIHKSPSTEGEHAS